MLWYDKICFKKLSQNTFLSKPVEEILDEFCSGTFKNCHERFQMFYNLKWPSVSQHESRLHNQSLRDEPNAPQERRQSEIQTKMCLSVYLSRGLSFCRSNSFSLAPSTISSISPFFPVMQQCDQPSARTDFLRPAHLRSPGCLHRLNSLLLGLETRRLSSSVIWRRVS
jgi:hypothetical protein